MSWPSRASARSSPRQVVACPLPHADETVRPKMTNRTVLCARARRGIEDACEPRDGLAQAVFERCLRHPPELARRLRDVGLATLDVLRPPGNAKNARRGARRRADRLRELHHGELFGPADVVDIAPSSALHRRQEPACRVTDVAERA